MNEGDGKKKKDTEKVVQLDSVELDKPADPNEVELTEESINSVIYGNLNKYQDMSLS